MSAATDFFLAAGGGIGKIPSFTSSQPNVRTAGNPFGFSDDGDFFVLPNGITGPLEYRNSATSLVWTKSPTDVDASCDAWLSFTLDTSDNLIYVTAFDAALDKIFLASINSAGTLVNIGDDIAANSLAASSQGWSLSSTTSRGGANMFRAVQGTGDFTIHSTSGGDGRVFVIDSANGTINSETLIDNQQRPGWFLSSSNVIFQIKSIVNLQQTSDISSREQLLTLARLDGVNSKGFDISAPLQVGLPATAQVEGEDRYPALSWGDTWFWARPGTINVGPNHFPKTQFNIDVNTLATNYAII